MVFSKIIKEQNILRNNPLNVCRMFKKCIICIIEIILLTVLIRCFVAGIRYIPIGDGLLIINASRIEDNRTFVCEVLESTTGQVIHKKIKFIVERK